MLYKTPACLCSGFLARRVDGEHVVATAESALVVDCSPGSCHRASQMAGFSERPMPGTRFAEGPATLLLNSSVSCSAAQRSGQRSRRHLDAGAPAAGNSSAGCPNQSASAASAPLLTLSIAGRQGVEEALADQLADRLADQGTPVLAGFRQHIRHRIDLVDRAGELVGADRRPGTIRCQHIAGERTQCEELSESPCCCWWPGCSRRIGGRSPGG